MPAGEELGIYHDTVSPLGYSSAPHGSCHTLKGQKNRLNMVGLAFLLTKLRGVWGQVQMDSLERCGVCTRAWLPVPLLQVMWKGNTIAKRTWCQFEVRGSDVTEGFAVVLLLGECFSSIILCIFTWFHVQRNFPWKPSASLQSHKSCMCMSGWENSSVFKWVSGHSQVYMWGCFCISIPNVLIGTEKRGNSFTINAFFCSSSLKVKASVRPNWKCWSTG